MAPGSSSFDFVLEHAAFARRLARAVVADDARADDVVQQTWVAALEHPPRPGRGMKSWLATVVRNTAAKLRREESRRQAREERVASPERLPPAAEVAEQIAAQRELLDAVARLAEPYRTAVHLRFFEERTPTEIAHALGAPVRTIETRLRRALEQLRADLDRRFAGGREAWAGLLGPASTGLGAPLTVGVATAEGATAAAATGSTAGLAGGGVLVSMQAKLAGATAAVVIAVGSWAVLRTTAAPPAGVQESSATPASTAAASTSPPAPTLVEAELPGRSPVAARRSAARCVVSVVTPDGRGIEGAILVLFRDDEEQQGTLLGDATTDESGTGVLPVLEDACELLVLPGCAPPQRLAIAAGTEWFEVAIDESEVFSGWVTVDGARPSEPVTLRLGTAANLYPRVEWPMSVGRRIRDLETYAGLAPWGTTDADGDFAFFGLPAATPFSVSLPVPYEDAQTGKEWTSIDAAREHVELALRTNPSFRGRVVDLQGAPLAGWRVVPWAVSEAGSSSQPEAVTDADGRFRSWLHNKHHERDHGAALIVYDPARVPVRRVDVAGSVAGGHDFGDVEVDAERRLVLDVRDADGRAVREMVAIVERDAAAWEVLGWNRYCVVDAQHVRGGFALPAEALAVRVLAPGFVAADVPCQPAAIEQVVALQPCARLELDVRNEVDRVLRSASLEVSAAEWPLSWSLEDVREAHRKLGGSAPDDAHDGVAVRTSCRFSTYDAPFRIQAVRTRVPLTLLVRDSLGVEVLREEVSLEPGEHRRIQRTVATPARTIRGVVKSVDGSPLAEASVYFFRDRRWNQVATRTAADGTFRLEGVRADRGTLVAAHPKHSQRSLRDHVVDEERPVAITLEGGWYTQINLFGDRRPTIPTAIWMERVTSRPVPDGADGKPDAGAFEPVIADESGYTFEGLPNEPMWLRATVDGFTFAIDLKNDRGSMSFNAMLRGPFDIEWDVVDAMANVRSLRALHLRPDGGPYGAGATVAVAPADSARGIGVARFEKLPVVGQFALALVWAEPDGRLVEEVTDVKVEPRKAERARISLRR